MANKGYIRTDSGEFYDHGNMGADVRHPDFAGGAKYHWEHDATEPFHLAIEFARKYGVPLLVPGHFKVSEQMNWHLLSVHGLPATLNTYDTPSFWYNSAQRSSILAGAGCSRLVKIGPASAIAESAPCKIDGIMLRADSSTDASCTLIGSDYGFSDIDMDLWLLGVSGSVRAKAFKGLNGYLSSASETGYYNKIKIYSKHIADAVKLNSYSASNGFWANDYHIRIIAAVRGLTLLNVQEANIDVLEINDFLDDYAPDNTADTGEWGSKIVGSANKVNKLSQEGDPTKPYHFFSFGTQVGNWRNPSRNAIQLLDDVGDIASMERHWQHVTIGQSNSGAVMADLGQANRAANLVTNGHFSAGADDGGSAADAQAIYNDWTVVKQEGTATMRVISTGLSGTTYLTYGNAVDLRVTNGVNNNFYGIQQDLLARHVTRNISKFREATFAAIVKGVTGTSSFRMRVDINGSVTTKDFALSSGAFADSLEYPSGEFQILIMDPVDLGAVSTALKVSAGFLSNGSATEQRMLIDSLILIPGIFNEYAMRALIEPAHMEAVRSRMLGTPTYPFAGLNLDKTISTAASPVTINKPCGRVRIANGSTSTVINNTLVDANSVVVLTPVTSMGSATNLRAILGSGTITVTVTTDPGADVDVNFAVVG